MTITIDTNVKHMQQDLQRVYDSIVDDWEQLSYVDVLTDTADKLEDEHRRYFQSGKNPAGEAWPPLAQTTVDRKGHARILVDKRRLESSLSRRTGDSIRALVVDPGNQHGLSFGTSVPYSIFHQKGLGRNPERKHVGMGRRFLDKLLTTITNATVRKLAERRGSLSQER